MSAGRPHSSTAERGRKWREAMQAEYAMGGKSLREIGHKFGVSRSAVHYHIRYARGASDGR